MEVVNITRIGGQHNQNGWSRWIGILSNAQLMTVTAVFISRIDPVARKLTEFAKMLLMECYAML